MKSLTQTDISPQDYKSYAVIFLVAIGARIFFLVWIDEPILFFKYPFFAEKLSQGKDIGERLVDLSPFYLYFLTLLKKIFGIDWVIVKFIQSFIGAINSLLILALGTHLFQKTTGILAALIYALYGNVIILESTLEPTVFVLLFNLLSVYFLLLAKEGARSPWQSSVLALTGGFFVGLLIITKPNALLFLPIGIGWLLFFPTGTLIFHERLARALMFCGLALLVVTPVTVRNYVRLKDFVLVTADAGKVFYHGNSKSATALEGADLPHPGLSEGRSDEPDYAHVLFRKTAARLTGKAMSPSESSRFWIGQTLSDISDDPPKYIRRVLKKCVFFFTDYEMHYIASAHKEYKRSLSFPFIRYGIIVSLGILGMLVSLRRFDQLFLLYAPVALYLFSGMLFIVQSRYRVPAVPYLCLFAARAILTLKDMFVARRFKTTCTFLLLAGVFFMLSHLAFRSEIVTQDRWQEATKTHYEMGARRLYDSGRYKEAVSELDRCLSIVPDFVPGLNLRGKAHAVLGKYQKAETDFKKVISLSPNAPEGYKNMGFVYLLEGETDKARTYLDKALALSPHDPKVREALKKLW